ncbi:MAG: methyl-accepting chemotaxis protein [Desulfuromonadaceae bacterium]
MNNLKIGVRLGLGFAIIVLLMLVVGGYSITKMSQLDSLVTVLVEDKYPKTVMLNDMKSNINIVARALRNIIILDDKEEIKKENQRIIDARELIGKRIEELSKVVQGDTGKALLKEVIEARTAFLGSLKTIIDLIEANDKEKARTELLTTVRKTQSAYFTAIDKMIEYQSKEVEKSGKAADESAMQGEIIVLGLLIAAVLISILCAFLLVRSITGPIIPLVAVARKIADGDLTVQIAHTSSDEIGDLSESFRIMAQNLRSMISQVSNTSTQIAAASAQLQATAEHIATGAEEVAAQAGTVATAGEEMSATSGDIAQNCQMAAEGAQRASQAASNGGMVVGKTVAVMGQIAAKVQESARTVESLGARSDQIGAIIGTIEDIADQTNLLALNAAIEAARAGEQGRGFAVVADEVRALAERTTRATKEIGVMIKTIQKETKGAVAAMEQGVQQVEAGTEEAAKSGQALQDILAQVNDVAMQINQIATAAEEQTATTSEISSNMQQITEVVQQTSQGAHESATAAAQLSYNAEELQRLVRQFKL